MENIEKKYPLDKALLEEKIGYTFKNKDYLIEALRHSSFVNEYKKEALQSNERLEFLGDAVLSLITAKHIFNKYPQTQEGDLTLMRLNIVDGVSLAGFAKEIGLGDYLFLGNGEELNGGRQKDKLLENAFEALIAALYLDGGINVAAEFVMPFINKDLESLTKTPTQNNLDPKSKLKSIVEQDKENELEYRIVDTFGPDHSKTFVCEVYLNSNKMGVGTGKSKKEAEKRAAEQALDYFE